MSERLDFDEISREIGLEPSHMHRAGEVNKIRKPYPQDMWLLESPLGKKKHLDAHLEWLEEQLRPAFPYLRSLKPRASIDLFCSYTGIGDGGLSLTPRGLSISVELDIKFELSIIVLRAKG